MELQSILKADYLDIIFDKRNKTYGGYELRKNYTQRAAKATGVVLTVLLLILGINTFASRFRGEEQIVLNDRGPHELTQVIEEVPKTHDAIKPPEPPTPEPPSPEPPAAAATIVNVTPEVVPDDQVTTPPPTVDDLENKVSGTVNSNGNGGLAPATSVIPGDGPGEIPTVVDNTPPPDKPEEYVDQMPEFNGNVGQYLRDNIEYPEMAKSSGTSGKVVIKFVVNEDGSISNAHVLKGNIGGGCEEEALRVVNKMPRWKPGKQNGQPVKVYYTLPIRFVLQ